MRTVVLVLLACLLVALPAPACGPTPLVAVAGGAVVVTPASPAVAVVAFVPAYGAGYVPQVAAPAPQAQPQQQPAPKAATVPQPQTMPPAEPDQAQAPAAASPVVARCAACHDAAVAVRKGGGVRLDSWDAEEAIAAVDAGTMPRGRKLTAREKAEVIVALAASPTRKESAP